MLSPKEQFQIISQDAVDFIQEKEFLKKLQEGRPLRVKAGFDPSRPDLHLGHSLLVNKLRQFQDLGHEIIFVVGDFTACIGDPSGQNKTRPLLSQEEAKNHASSYIHQVTSQSFTDDSADEKTKKLLEFLKRLDKTKTRVVFNSEWLSSLSIEDFVTQIGSHLTVARQLERNDFSARYSSGKPIRLHEFIYPALQAYDSLKLEADIEIGGTDQLFNLLLGRELQERFQKPAQCVLTLPLLEGLDGVQKMSKSLNNEISFNDSPKDIFGKVMKISDELLIKYWFLLTSGYCDQDFKQKIKNQTLNPKKQKEDLAWGIVCSFYGKKEADKSQEEFERVFSHKGLPDHIPEKTVKASQGLWICHLIKEVGLSSSTSEASRQIQAGAIKREGEKLSDIKQKIDLKAGDSFLLSSGKRKFVKVKVV